MRHDTNVTFISSSKDRYDPDLGEWVEGELRQTVIQTNVTDLGSDRSIALFGDVQENSKVIRFLPYQDVPEFDYLTIKGLTYKLTRILQPLNRTTLIIKEFSNG